MKKVYHIVILKFKADPEETARQLFAALGELRPLPGMLEYSFGPNNSTEGLNQGFTHAFIMAFADAAARDHYLNHPDHEKVKQRFLPLVANVLVLDYEGTT